MSQSTSGRVNQKQRTRAALLTAAREMLEEGGDPTIQSVADRATISRATAYRYYSSTELLLQEAVLDGIASQIRDRGLEAGKGDTLEGRVEKLVADVVDMVLDNEALFRTYLRTAVTSEGSKARGGRRLEWLRDAFGGDPRISSRLADRLTFALALLTGIETVIVAKDICGFDDKQTRASIKWVAQAIMKGALD